MRLKETADKRESVLILSFRAAQRSIPQDRRYRDLQTAVISLNRQGKEIPRCEAEKRNLPDRDDND